MATISPTNTEEVGTVLCTICEKGIRVPVDLVIKGYEVMHRRCHGADSPGAAN